MIKAFFQIIRWPNQVILILSMYLMYDPIVKHLLGPHTAGFGMNMLDFALLVGTTVLLASGGYIINDITDREADRTNKPGKNKVGTVFSLRQAWILYTLTSAGSFVTGTWISFRVGAPEFTLLILLIMGMLFLYAKIYQCRPLVGNLVVALFSGLSFGLVWVGEVLSIVYHSGHALIHSAGFNLVFRINLIYVGFALLVSLLREIVKDAEDVEGDKKVGCRTFAVVYGNTKARNLALNIAVIGWLGSFFIQWVFYRESLMILFFYFFLVDLLFSLIIFKLVQATEKAHFSSLSLWIKILMLTGVLSMALFYLGG